MVDHNWETFRIFCGELDFMTYSRSSEERIEFLEENFSFDIKPDPLDYEQEKLARFLGILAVFG